MRAYVDDAGREEGTKFLQPWLWRPFASKNSKRLQRVDSRHL